jgi:hypothetical protein
MMLVSDPGITTKLDLPQVHKLAGVAILFQKEDVALAIRITGIVVNRRSDSIKVGQGDLQPAVTRVIVFNEGGVHRVVSVVGFYEK